MIPPQCTRLQLCSGSTGLHVIEATTAIEAVAGCLAPNISYFENDMMTLGYTL